MTDWRLRDQLLRPLGVADLVTTDSDAENTHCRAQLWNVINQEPQRCNEPVSTVGDLYCEACSSAPEEPSRCPAGGVESPAPKALRGLRFSRIEVISGIVAGIVEMARELTDDGARPTADLLEELAYSLKEQSEEQRDLAKLRREKE